MHHSLVVNATERTAAAADDDGGMSKAGFPWQQFWDLTAMLVS